MGGASSDGAPLRLSTLPGRGKAPGPAGRTGPHRRRRRTQPPRLGRASRPSPRPGVLNTGAADPGRSGLQRERQIQKPAALDTCGRRTPAERGCGCRDRCRDRIPGSPMHRPAAKPDIRMQKKHQVMQPTVLREGTVRVVMNLHPSRFSQPCIVAWFAGGAPCGKSWNVPARITSGADVTSFFAFIICPHFLCFSAS